MADSLLAREVSDLCLGKPALRSLTASATVAQALLALRRFGDSYVSVWSCNHRQIKSPDVGSKCRCVGKVCMVDVVCFLAREENLKNPAIALQKPLSFLLDGIPLGIVRHLEPHASLLEAIDLILEGAQNLVIPIHSRFSSRKKLIQRNSVSVSSTVHNGGEYCWLTQEDVIRYLLNCIGFFSPLPSQTIESLNIIDKESVLAVRYDDPAESALPLISQSLAKHTSVAILDDQGRLVGEISPAALNYCDESVAAAVATLSAGDLMAYVDCWGDPPEELVQLVKERLKAKNLEAAVELIEEDSSSGLSSVSSMSSCSSSDEEFGERSVNWNSPKVVRNTEDIVCYPWSSLVAVMIQTLSHRTGYIWVVEDDGCLAGVVTYAAMTKVFRERLKSMAGKEELGDSAGLKRPERSAAELRSARQQRFSNLDVVGVHNKSVFIQSSRLLQQLHFLSTVRRPQLRSLLQDHAPFEQCIWCMNIAFRHHSVEFISGSQEQLVCIKCSFGSNISNQLSTKR